MKCIGIMIGWIEAGGGTTTGDMIGVEIDGTTVDTIDGTTATGFAMDEIAAIAMKGVIIVTKGLSFTECTRGG